MIGPTDRLHPSPAPHLKTFQVFLIYVGTYIPVITPEDGVNIFTQNAEV